jgi:site-specific DNA-cytosine methylase
MKVLIACEESQAVCIEFRKRGHEAYSCDILPCSGGHSEWHFRDDIINVIHCTKWDMMIAFPPCTHLAVSGAKHFEQKRKDGRQQEGINFFMSLINANIPKIAIENPVGIMSTIYRKPDCIIQPWQFGDKSRKTTCLWLKNIPPLFPTQIVTPDIYTCKNGKTFSRDYMVSLSAGKNRGHLRSKTYPGIAKAMAEQWG